MTKVTGSSDSFGALPDELVIRILHSCSYEGVLRFAVTSKRYCDVVANSVSLQLQIELEANGLETIKGTWKGSTTYSLLLDELVRYRDAWLHLQFEKPTERILGKRAWMSIWELREGIYGMALSSTSEISLGFDSLQMTPIDLADVPDPITFWSNFHEFTYDSEQELVALLKADLDDDSRFEIRLCSTITGLAHPLAQKPTLIVQVDFRVPSPDDELQAFITEIMDDIVVVRVAALVGPRYEIMAWNWKSGALLSRIGSSCGAADFSFLDKNHLALFSADKDDKDLRLVTLSLYSLSTHTCDGTQADSYFCASKYACARPILTFEFPELEDFYAVHPARLYLRSDPVPGRVAYTKSAGFFHPTALTFNITLSLIHSPTLPDETFVQFRIFISAMCLLRYMPESTCEGGTVVIPWATWGIQATRWFLYDRVIDYWLYWSFGSRFISVGERPLSGLYDLSVFDFHPPTVRRHGICDLRHSLAMRQTPVQAERLLNMVTQGKRLIVEHPSSLERSDLAVESPVPLITETIGSDIPTIITKGFFAPVESRLPYRVVTRPKFLPRCEDWLIDGDHVMGTNPLHHDSDVFERITAYKLRT